MDRLSRDELAEEGAALVRMARRAGDPAARLRAAHASGVVHLAGGEFDAAAAELEQAADVLAAHPAGSGAAEVFGNLAIALAYGDTPAGKALDRLRDLYARAGTSRLLSAAVGCPMALVLDMLGRRGEADGVMAGSRAALRRVGHLPAMASLHEFDSLLRARRGEWAAAARSIVTAAHVYRRMGAAGEVAWCRARACLYLQRPLGEPELAVTAEEPTAWNRRAYLVLARAVSARTRWDTRALVRQARGVVGELSGSGARATMLVTARRVAAGLGDRSLVAELDVDLARACEQKGIPPAPSPTSS